MFNKNVGYFKTQGIGIGLTTAKVLSKALLGGIHLSSTFGKGTQVGFSVFTQNSPLKIESETLRRKTEEMMAKRVLVDKVDLSALRGF